MPCLVTATGAILSFLHASLGNLLCGVWCGIWYAELGEELVDQALPGAGCGERVSAPGWPLAGLFSDSPPPPEHEIFP